MSTTKISLEKDTTPLDDTPAECCCKEPLMGSRISMLLFLLLGALLGLSQHFYYSYLDTKAVQDHPFQQQLAHGIGTALAFGTKMFLALAVGTAYTQRIWKIAKEKPFSLPELDAMFCATTDATAFLTFKIIPHLSTLLALFIWLLPITAMVAPSTLIIQPKEFTSELQHFHILSPNFATASLAAKQPPLPISYVPNQRAAVPQVSSNQLANVLEGSNLLGQRAVFQRSSPSDVYNGPKPSLSRLAMIVLLTGDIRPISAPTNPLIEGPINASYTLEFNGPFLGCETAEKILLQTMNLDSGPPGNTTDFLATLPDGYPWRLQVAQGIRNQTNSLRDASGIVCQVYNATYDVLLNFNNGQNIINVKSIISQNSTLPDPTNSTDVQIINYRAFMEAFIDPILAYGPDLQGVYVDRPLLRPNLTLKNGIEQLWQNYTLSLLNSELSDLNISTILTDVSTSYMQNVFVYNARNLILAYGIAIFFASFGVFVGMHARVENKQDHTNSFSSIFCTTRNTGPAQARNSKLKLKKDLSEDPQDKNHTYWKFEDKEPKSETEKLLSNSYSA